MHANRNFSMHNIDTVRVTKRQKKRIIEKRQESTNRVDIDQFLFAYVQCMIMKIDGCQKKIDKSITHMNNNY